MMKERRFLSEKEIEEGKKRRSRQGDEVRYREGTSTMG